MFDGMFEKDVVYWNVVIDGYTQNGISNETFVLYSYLGECYGKKEKEMKPSM